MKSRLTVMNSIGSGMGDGVDWNVVKRTNFPFAKRNDMTECECVNELRIISINSSLNSRWFKRLHSSFVVRWHDKSFTIRWILPANKTVKSQQKLCSWYTHLNVQSNGMSWTELNANTLQLQYVERLHSIEVAVRAIRSMARVSMCIQPIHSLPSSVFVRVWCSWCD